MIGDRDYMRRGNPRGGFPFGAGGGFGDGFGGGGFARFVLSSAINSIIAACFIALFLQTLLDAWFGLGFFERIFALSVGAAESFKIWTFVSYAFLHEGFLHFFLNMLVLYFAGRIVESFEGRSKTWAIFLFCALCGGLTWFLSAYLRSENAYLVGASAGAVGMLAYFCLVSVDRPLTFLLFFVIPVRLRPRTMLWWILGFEVFGFLFYEVAPNGGSAIAYSGHMGGIFGAMLFAKFLGGINIFSPSRGGGLFSGLFKKPAAAVRANRAEDAAFSVNISDRDALRKEVNRILDKMNTEGFASLTDAEKNILNRAKDVL